MNWIIHSGGGDYYGPFATVEEAEAYAAAHEDEVGDYDVQPIAK